MAALRRRQVIEYGAAGALAAPIEWAASDAASAAPPSVQAADDLALWYDEPAGTDWLRALPVGNGRLGTATSRQWSVTDHGNGTVSLVNRQSGLAMDVWSASTADGARISQWHYTGGTNQRFQLQRA